MCNYTNVPILEFEFRLKENRKYFIVPLLAEIKYILFHVEDL